MINLELIICIAGIYTCFLSWGVLQEKITTRPYIHNQESIKFNFFIFLNFIQSVFAFTVALLYTRLSNSVIGSVSPNLLVRYTLVAVLSSLASPFGYESLKHLDYPTMILAKSCKLIPVMIMSFILYRKTYSLIQYLSVLLITAGVFIFTFNHEDSKGGYSDKANSFYGLFLLFINLLIDGITNSTQDEIITKFGGTSTQMMFYMNFLSSCLMLGYMLIKPVYDFFSSEFSYKSELLSAIDFFQKFPEALTNVLLFGLTGAIGQVFIFYVINRFGSRVLVTVNVTRKMMTIMLSVVWFGHVLNVRQWGAVGLVFVAILAEYFGKSKSEKVKDEGVDIDKKNE